MDVVVAAAVVVEQRLAAINPVLPFGDYRAGLPLGAVEHRFDRRVGDLPAKFLGERQHPALADMGRADHRREVAAEIARMADIGRDHLHHVAPHLAAVVKLQRRDAQAFLPDIGGAGVIGAVRGAADVALVRPVDRPETRLAAIGAWGENRDERGQIRKVVAAVIGVVEQKHVARMDVGAEELGDRAGGEGEGADMDRHVLGLGDEAPIEVADRGREIAARIEDLRIGRAQHCFAHLGDDRQQAMLDHRNGDGVDRVCHDRLL